MNAFFAGLRAALFDLDGTLVETHIDFPLMKREALALVGRFGVATGGLEELDILTIVEEARRRLEADGRPDEGRRLRAEAFERLAEIEVAHCANPVEAPGAAELLARLRETGVSVAVVTRNSRAVSERLLDWGGLRCDALVTRDDVPLTKPHPSHLLAALARLSLPPDAAGESVMVGDHWMDVRAGRLAGMRTVGILRGRRAAHFAPEPPDLLVDGPADLLDDRLQ